MNSYVHYPWFKKLLLPFCLFIYALIICNTAYGQLKPLSPGKRVSLENPPRPIEVTVSVETYQQLNFGTFILTGTSGSVTVSSAGVRSFSSPDFYAPGSMSSTVSAALFNVNAEPGTLITILNGPNARLYGPGGNLILTIGESSTGSPFITTGISTPVFIGGTLTVGSITATPEGAYTGTFEVTFIQQ